VKIQQIFKKFWDKLYNAAILVSFQLDNIENSFALVLLLEDNSWKLLLIDLLTLGTLGTVGPSFNTILEKQVGF
jgi:hypothetical protein